MITDNNNLEITCPFNNSHIVKKYKIMSHINKCKDRKSYDLNKLLNCLGDCFIFFKDKNDYNKHIISCGHCNSKIVNNKDLLNNYSSSLTNSLNTKNSINFNINNNFSLKKDNINIIYTFDRIGNYLHETSTNINSSISNKCKNISKTNNKVNIYNLIVISIDKVSKIEHTDNITNNINNLNKSFIELII